MRFLRDFLAILIAKVAWQVGTETGEEFANPVLILLILRVLPCRYELSEPSRCLEQYQVRYGANTRPVVICLRHVTGPNIKSDPDTLLGRKIGMSTPGPKANYIETSVKVLLVVLAFVLSRLQIVVLCILETCGRP